MKHLRITIEGKTYEVDVEILGEETEPRRSPSAAPARARPASAAPVAAPAAPAPAAAPSAAAAGDVVSPLAGTVVSVDVKIGDTVAAGAPVVTLEAMKMNTIVNASAAGTVSAIHVQAGQAVEEGKPLLTIA